MLELHTSYETSTFQTGLAACDTIQIFPLDGNWTLDLTETAASIHQHDTRKISERIIIVVTFVNSCSLGNTQSCMKCKAATCILLK